MIRAGQLGEWNRTLFRSNVENTLKTFGGEQNTRAPVSHDVPDTLSHTTAALDSGPGIALGIDVATSENDICLKKIIQMSRHVATFALKQ